VLNSKKKGVQERKEPTSYNHEQKKYYPPPIPYYLSPASSKNELAATNKKEWREYMPRPYNVKSFTKEPAI
jgi:hypothetical protein